MFRLENIVCCRRDNCEDEEIYLPALFAINLGHGAPMVLYDSESTRESMFKKVQPEYRPTSRLKGPTAYPIACGPAVTIRVQWPKRCFDAPLQRKLSVLNDWATALRARHAKGVAHGNLTSESVDVVRGMGVVLDQRPPPVRQWVEAPPDEDLYGVRWAATELFLIDNSNARPTTMSDVYSFACLMLQLLTGSVPYCATERPEQVVYLKYLGREPIDAQTPRVADRYATFMRRCWSLEPGERPTMESIVGFIRDEIERLGDQ